MIQVTLPTRQVSSGLAPGMYARNQKAGVGVMTFANGDVYEGEWQEDTMHGRGTYRCVGPNPFLAAFKQPQLVTTGFLLDDGWGMLFVFGDFSD